VKLSRVGGPVAVAEIATLAAERGVPVVISSLFETGVGLAAGLACAASLPDVPGWPAADRDHGLATSDLLRDDLLVARLLVKAGRMRAPGGPRSGALGVTVDESVVHWYEVPDA
jgi:O-succinylbenzoate synthase